jgi:spermidine/putrescine transport system permease protein
MLFVVMMSPDIVLAISLLVLFILLGVKLGYLSLLLAHVTFCLPFVVVTVYARLSGFNAQIIEAARDLGASEWQMLRTVLVPIIFPAVMAGWLLGFTLSLDDVVVSIFVTGPTFEVLPLRIYSMVRLGVKPEVNALAAVLLVLSLLALLASQYFLSRKIH